MVAGPETVLFIHSGQDWIRGSEPVLLDLATGLSRDRFRPVVWCDAPALRRACQEAENALVEEAFPQNSDRPWWRAQSKSIAAAVHVIVSTGARVVHVNNLDDLPWALRAARRARVPIVAHLHSPTTPDERIWSGVHQVTVAVGVSRYALEWADRDGMPASATRLIYNGVVPERLERGDATHLRSQLGVPPGAMVAVTVGSLIPRKDIGLVIQAVHLTATTSQDLHFLVVGEGEDRARLEALVREAGLADRIHFLGDREEAGAIFRDVADVLISAAESETFGLNIIEAGFFGVPGIITDIPPHRELVTHEANGLLFQAGNAEELARNLLFLKRDPAMRRRLGDGARERVHEAFLADRLIREFEQLYQEVISLPRWRSDWLGGLRVPRCYRGFAIARLTGRS